MKKLLWLLIAAALAIGITTVSIAATGGDYTTDEYGNVELDVELLQKGDVNGDGRISAEDVTVLLRHVAHIDEISDEYKQKCGNVIGDSRLSAEDVTKLLRYVAHIDDSLD